MTKLILVRHGESEANRHNIFAGQIDPDLQQRGVEQARLTAKYIEKNYNVDKIYSSDLKRAYKTAECLAEVLGLEIIPKKELREINGGAWEGMVFDKIPESYPEEFRVWIEDIGSARCYGGESIKELSERIMSELTKIAEENDEKTIAIATHATPIRVAMSLIKTKGLKAMQNIPWVSNASVTVFEYDNGEWTIKAESVDEHLSELRTSLPGNV